MDEDIEYAQRQGAIMYNILSLTGPSGVGKTTLARELIASTPHVKMIASTTTRAPRLSDIPGECRHVSTETFEEIRQRGGFLWSITHGGNLYGTEADAVLSVCTQPNTLGVIILTPDAVPLLSDFLAKEGHGFSLLPVFIEAPPRRVLEARLRKRGDSEDAIKLRLDQAEHWSESSKDSNPRFTFISNTGKLDEALAQLKAMLR